MNLGMKIKKNNSYDIKILLQNHEFSGLITTSCFAIKISRTNPQHLKTNNVPFSHKIANHYSCTRSCNGNKFTPMCFLLNS